MGRPLTEPNYENCTQQEMMIAMKAAPTRKSFLRIFAIHQLYCGAARDAVAYGSFVTQRTLRSWINSFNEQGIDGLIDKPINGRPKSIKDEQSKQYRVLIEHPNEAGQTHWTARKFHGYLRETLQHEMGYSTVLRWLKENNYRLKIPRPWPEKQDEDKRRIFLEHLGQHLSDKEIDVWYGDEMGVEGDPRPRRRWAKKGEKITVGHNGGHIRMNVSGIVCPRSGEFYALEFSHSDSVTFQVFLDMANADVKFERQRNILIVDNATWHKKKSIKWGRFEPVFLPPYSPDLNPIERLWLLIKAEWFADFTAKDHNALIERIDKALCWAMNRSSANQKTCRV